MNSIAYFPFDVHLVVDHTDDVTPGKIFIATSPSKALEQSQKALLKGAHLIIASPEICQQLQCATYPVDHPRLILSQIAAQRYPLQPDFLVAVTGTNGKTSVAHFFKEIFNYQQKKAACIGTLGIQTTHSFNAYLEGLTSYPPLIFHQTLQSLTQEGFSHVCFEASSHGLDQWRCAQARLKAAAFTNLTQDHLDYHGTMENYFLSKARLFEEILPSNGTLILNLTSTAYAARIKKIGRMKGQKIITTSVHEQADIYADNIHLSVQGIKFDLIAFGQSYENLFLSMVGLYQLENILVAIGLACACEVDIASVVNTLQYISAVKGRLEKVGEYRGASVYIDYAHTPDALKNVLETLLAHQPSRLHVLFGCGGQRDSAKRPLMGAIAKEYADQIVITDDNPRSEDPAIIRAQILAGAKDAVDIGDRKQAIRFCLEQLQAGDILVIAGKGHETYQIIGNTLYDFNDAQVVQQMIKDLTK